MRNIPLSQVMDTVAYVSQDNFLFHLSVKENIRMGKPGATDEEIVSAAKQASCMNLFLPCRRDMIRWWETAAGACPVGSASALPLPGRS